MLTVFTPPALHAANLRGCLTARLRAECRPLRGAAAPQNAQRDSLSNEHSPKAFGQKGVMVCAPLQWDLPGLPFG